jgi:thymidylate synthase
MNNLDIAYQALLQDILDNGVTKKDRTGTGTISVFGRQIRHKMSDGIPLLTTKKMYWKGIVTELLWFLRGDTNIKYLVDNGCHIWDGDAFKSFKSKQYPHSSGLNEFEMEDVIIAIKNGHYKEYNLGELGPIYGKQWREWSNYRRVDSVDEVWSDYRKEDPIDQIANSINLLKTDPDSRRNKVSAWNVGELSDMVLPPCHTDFQFYTRELSLEERRKLWDEKVEPNESAIEYLEGLSIADMHDIFDQDNVKSRAISLMWNQRSVDTFLGLPFNIASYGLLLEIVAKIVNMVPDELIGNLGDTHLYVNHIEQAKEQISRELSLEERRSLVSQEMFNQIYTGGSPDTLSHSECDQWDIPRIIQREPYPLPTLRINTEFWPTESGECGIGNLTDDIDFLIKEMQINDFQIENYKSHPAIKAPLSN